MGLDGRIIGLSLSPPADLGRLGFPAREFDRLAFELAMRIIQKGGRVLYGGHLQADSLTIRMFEFLGGAYASSGISGEPARRPFVHLLSPFEFHRTPFPRLIELLRGFSAFAETSLVESATSMIPLATKRAMDRDGRPTSDFVLIARTSDGEITVRNQAQMQEIHAGPDANPARSATLMRMAAEHLVSARIAAGGKRGDPGVPEGQDLYQGEMAGIIQELIFSFNSQHPVIVLGGYGGAARDAAIALELAGPGARVPFLADLSRPQLTESDNMPADVRSALQKLADYAKALGPDAFPALKDFALRTDTEDLAKDAVGWLSERLGPRETQNTQAGPS